MCLAMATLLCGQQFPVQFCPTWTSQSIATWQRRVVYPCLEEINFKAIILTTTHITAYNSAHIRLLQSGALRGGLWAPATMDTPNKRQKMDASQEGYMYSVGWQENIWKNDQKLMFVKQARQQQTPQDNTWI